MTSFDIGHRVVVKTDNLFDKPMSPVHGPMAGHFGRVVDVDTGGFVMVELTGKVDGPPSPLALAGPAKNRPAWIFLDFELEHAD